MYCHRCGAEKQARSSICPVCGFARRAVTAPRAPQWGAAPGSGPQVRLAPGYWTLPPKRLGLAVLLAALLGPLGLLYSTVSGALYMLLASCFLILASCEDWIANDLVSMLIAWPICVAWAALAVRMYNEDRR